MPVNGRILKDTHMCMLLKVRGDQHRHKYVGAGSSNSTQLARGHSCMLLLLVSPDLHQLAHWWFLHTYTYSAYMYYSSMLLVNTIYRK